ncbi:hypothetical protein GHK86_09070 [Acidimicrobiaceae bacterium USS-CC1]|uniref:Glycosyltransferase RgtA/B/C/D-like domain-containing protein n=1 Tax=Acidiferrimicrobium australe TaxID=2664430 RepID=A0ABW9QT39_9ACTN|nr:hypothetical protein [Acidiferrimicrobium australe]
MSLTAPTPPALIVEAAAAGGEQPVVGRHPRLGPLFNQWGAEVGVLTLVGLVVPLALGAYYGTLSAPSSDDWAYDLAVFHLAHTGHLFLYHWITINFVGQAVLALPFVLLFGAHIAVLNTWTCCVGCCGLLALCHLGRSIGLPRSVALAASAFVGLTPVWLGFSVSFMTDVPAMTFMALALAVAAADRRTDRYVTPHAAAALVLGFVAFTIREMTCPVLVAIVVAGAWRSGRPRFREVRHWLALAAGFALLTLAEYAWRHTLPGEGYQPPLVLHPLTDLGAVAAGWPWPLAGLLLFPAVLYRDGTGAVRRLWSMQPHRALLLSLAVPTALYLREVASVTRTGTYDSLPVVERALSTLALPFGTQAFDLSWYTSASTTWHWVLLILSLVLTVLTLASWTMITALVTEQLLTRQEPRSASSGRPTRLVGVTGTLAALLFTTLFGVQMPLFERDEMVALVPLGLALLVAHGTRHRRPVLAGVAAATIASASILVTAPLVATAGRSWAAALGMARSHPSIPRRDIGVGYVWNSYQARTIVFGAPHACYVLTETPGGQGRGIDRMALGVPYDRTVLGFRPVGRPLPAHCRAATTSRRVSRRLGGAHRQPTTAPRL